MAKSSFRFFAGIVLVVVIAISLDRLVLHNAMSNAVNAMLHRPSSYVLERSGLLRAVISEYRLIRTLAKENERLRQENTSLLARVGYEESLERTNTALRESLNLLDPGQTIKLEGGLVAYHLQVPGYHVLINRGERDGVAVGDVVISYQGVLIGRITKVADRTATVQVITDPTIEVAVQLLGKETRAIARGDLDRGMSLNLVVQEESVTEGDTVVSSGHDRFPAGLVLGTVVHVDANESDVFKRIRVEPAMEHIPLGPVLILGSR